MQEIASNAVGLPDATALIPGPLVQRQARGPPAWLQQHITTAAAVRVLMRLLCMLLMTYACCDEHVVGVMPMYFSTPLAALKALMRPLAP